MKPELNAIHKLKLMVETLRAGSVRETYHQETERHSVVVEFRSEADRKLFYRQLCDCGLAVALLDEPEEERLTDEHPASVGSFRHDAGGGKRNIRSTNSLS